MAHYTRKCETKPEPGTAGDTVAWLFDAGLGEIVLHNRRQRSGKASEAEKKAANTPGQRRWRSAVTANERSD